MAKKAAEIINGFKIPGGRGGAAVLRACQMVRQNPGIKQADLINHVTSWANLNLSTAGWITSPGPKSPAEILWDRRKEGRGFKCYPNEHTPDIDPRVSLRAIVTKEFDAEWVPAGSPVPGDLVSVKTYSGTSMGLLVGYEVWHRYQKIDRNINCRDDLDDINQYNFGSFWLHPVVMIENRRTVSPMGYLRKIS